MGARALLLYVVAWLAAGAVVVLIALAALAGREDEVSLPPVRQTQLAGAARAGGCELRGPEARLPAVTGPSGRPAPPGIYSRPVPASALIGALRRGTVVIHYRQSVGDDLIAQLEELQKAVPNGTILMRTDGMAYAVAVAAWERLLGCPRFGAATLDAIRLFRGRFIGTGPDS